MVDFATKMLAEYHNAGMHGETWDKKYTDIGIMELHPIIRPYVFCAINKLSELGINVRVTDWLRTFDEQDELYAQGRKAPGRIVTFARAGESWHNFGFAVDVVEIVAGTPMYEGPNWLQIGRIFEGFGFDWGGRWLSERQKEQLSEDEQLRAREDGDGFDRPHVQRTFGLTLESANYLHSIKKGKYITT